MLWSATILALRGADTLANTYATCIILYVQVTNVHVIPGNVHMTVGTITKLMCIQCASDLIHCSCIHIITTFMHSTVSIE